MLDVGSLAASSAISTMNTSRFGMLVAELVALVRKVLSNSGALWRSLLVCQESCSEPYPFQCTRYSVVHCFLLNLLSTISSTSYSSETCSPCLGSVKRGLSRSEDRWYNVRCSRLTTLCMGIESGNRSWYANGLTTSVTSKGPMRLCMSLRPAPLTSTNSRLVSYIHYLS